jgi:AcrR family transcriptional regulator
MARIIKQEEYDRRRNKILDATQRLVYTKGYEQMSIQDILAEVQISKGAFYHYFASKQDLMEGLIERIANQAIQQMEPIARDEHLNATEKLLRLFDFAARWKTARMEYLISLVGVWYADENAILRLKSQAAVIPLVTPLVTSIIQQGIREGAFHTSYPEQSCVVIFTMLMSFGDSLVQHILHPQPTAMVPQYLQGLTASYQEAIERILGAAPGSLPLFTPAILKEWFTPTNNHKYQGAQL